MKPDRPRASWIFGLHSVRAVLSRRPEAISQLATAGEGRGVREVEERARALGVEVRAVTGRELTELCGSDAHQGVAVKARLPEYVELSEVMARPPFVVVCLDGITDPHNLGAIVRTAESLGASGIVVPQDRSAGISTVAHKTSAGALEWLPMAQVVNLARALRELKEDGYWIYGADPDGETALMDVDFANKTALVIGAEGKGIRTGIEKELDFRVKIPLAGHTESLNAGVASAIMLFQILRKKSGG